MKKEGYVYQCKICSDGRLYNGVWSVASGVPHPLPENVVVFDEFPSKVIKCLSLPCQKQHRLMGIEILP